MDDELVIDESNFSNYFTEVGYNKPSKGECMVVYRAVAELHDGDIKRDVINLLCQEEIGAKQAIEHVVKRCKTNYKEAIKIVTEICGDLHAGISKDLVLAKTYEYILEIFYYVNPIHVPRNDKHWEVISIKNIDEYMKNLENKDNTIKDEESFKETN